MPQTLFEIPQLKQLLKQALTETLTEQRDLLREVFADALEDVALLDAIREGEATETVERDAVFAVLEETS
ncbi:hypothetical protein Thiowin_01020 [Thiorhodovibrio winogradskyi]|uniref:Uncharacterized protein n=2 Tax=Thiorhodovibrio winogradskyi TaxID=77007 RepID=A0ABZ0S653_9GAMM